MSILEQELKELQASLAKADAALAAASQSITGSQQALKEAKAARGEISQRLAPVAKAAGELEAIQALLETQQLGAAAEMKEAEEAYADLFPLACGEVAQTLRDALETAETAVGYGEEAVEKIEEKITAAAETAQAAAEAEAKAADASVGKLLATMRKLPTEIQKERQEVAATLTAARRAFAAGRSGEAFLDLRELNRQTEELKTIADEALETQFTDQIFAEWMRGKDARAEAAKQAEQLIALGKEQTAAEEKLEQAEAELEKARAAVITAKRQPARAKPSPAQIPATASPKTR